MRPVLAIPRAALVAGVLVAGVVQAGEPDEPRFELRSDPSGAMVETITGNAGTTPIAIPQRAVYPNSYPPEKIELYGVVVLRKAGCEPRQVRLSDTDLRQGLTVGLDCGDDGGMLLEPRSRESGDADRSLPQRRLRQLRVVQELQDDGLLSEAEADRLRRRILRAD